MSDPKTVDQPGQLPSGKFTQNGKFHQAAQEFKAGRRSPERVRVYEKIKSGIWSYNGIFHLVDSWQECDTHRTVFKFRLIAVPLKATKTWRSQSTLMRSAGESFQQR